MHDDEPLFRHLEEVFQDRLVAVVAQQVGDLGGPFVDDRLASFPRDELADVAVRNDVIEEFPEVVGRPVEAGS